jgi:DNA-binding NarL/FixJ family response regulator
MAAILGLACRIPAAAGRLRTPGSAILPPVSEAERIGGAAESAARIRCVVVDDHTAVREGVKMILARDPELVVVGDAPSGEAAVDVVDRRLPDVVVMDVRMRNMDGLEATRRITAAHPTIGVVLYTAHGERGLLSEALDCGARGYVLKDAPPDDVVRAVKTVAGGGAYVEPTLASDLVTPRATDRLPTLSAREREILGMLANGSSNPDIAARLFISPETVRTHVRNAMGKLEADTRTQAVALALRYAIID